MTFNSVWEIAGRVLDFVDKHNGAVTAVATIFIAVFTIVLAFVTRRQAHLTRELLKISRDEFTSSHPPRIVVRRVSLDRGSIAIDPISSQWKIQYIIANTGRGAATIFEANATVKKISGVLPAIPPFDDAGDIPMPFRLAPGESIPWIVDLDLNGPIIQSIRMGEAQGDGISDVYFFGYLQYRDNIGIVRRTAFCRRYIISMQRFTVVPDPDYEYGD
jgi:hypothetical protein